ncbi:class I SAM-dependent methyltransferase [Candidatus Peregrinibacteria bacterium]|nr:class I SAM-dependent methyltransferase [Candidatus Peregrinibacteria bacterium]
MKKEHFERFFESRYALHTTEMHGDDIISGKLVSRDRRHMEISIENSIPRFVSGDNYAGNFGLQWNHFRSTQLDSFTGKPLTKARFDATAKWTADDMRGKTVLEAGSGAGRFTEILLAMQARVVSFDYSGAVDANYKNNAGKGETLFFQGDIFNIPFSDKLFDFVFCHGVLQHTPNPEQAFYVLERKVKSGGRISIDIYHKDGKIRPWKSKYIWRPLTTRIAPERLLAFLKVFIPLWLPFDTVIKAVPLVRNYVGAVVPCWNYFYTRLPLKQQIQWAIMDTFDALGAKYDIPVTLCDVERWFRKCGYKKYEVFEGGNGIVGNGTKHIS